MVTLLMYVCFLKGISLRSFTAHNTTMYYQLKMTRNVIEMDLYALPEFQSLP
jgi:hypothetical protein